MRLFVVMLLFTLISIASAAEPVAVIIKERGSVNLSRGQDGKTVVAQKGMVLYDGDKIKTGKNAFCALKFIDDKSLIRIKEQSVCVIEGKREKDHINKNIVVEIGTFFASLFKQRGTFTITTPTSVAAVKGTKFWILQLPDGNTLYIGIEGLIDLSNDAGRVLLRSGQTAVFNSSEHLPEIRLTLQGEIPRMEDELERNKKLEIEFINPEGQKKTLEIDYEEK